MTDHTYYQESWEPGERKDLIGRDLVPFFATTPTPTPTPQEKKKKVEIDTTNSNVFAEDSYGIDSTTNDIVRNFIEGNDDLTTQSQHHTTTFATVGDKVSSRKKTPAKQQHKFAAPAFLTHPDPKDVPLPSWLRNLKSIPSKQEKRAKSSTKSSTKHVLENKDKTKPEVSALSPRFDPDRPLTDQTTRDQLKDLCARLPKAELRAYLTGSVRPNTARELFDPLVKRGDVAEEELIRALAGKTPADVIDAQRLLDLAVGPLNAATRVIRECMEDYAAEGVRYLEIRVNVRSHPSHREYLTGLLRAIGKPPSVRTAIGPRPLVVRLIVELSRDLNADEAMLIVSLASEFVQSNLFGAKTLLVGIGVGGPPKLGYSASIGNALQRARDSGLKITLDFADQRHPKKDAPDREKQLAARSQEELTMLNWGPERVAHALYMTKAVAADLAQLKIPVEVPVSCHYKYHGVSSKKRSALARLLRATHPCVICCDRRALFGSLSAEYMKSCVAFKMTPKNLREMSIAGFQFAFVEEEERTRLLSAAKAELSNLL